MKIHEVKQGSEEWLALRAGLPTASELDELLTPEYAHRTGDKPRTYLCRKLAERWQGYPMQSFGGGVLEQGSLLEEEAIPWLELFRRCDIQRVGFLTTDDDRFGCSPDGLIEGSGVEIKCPQPPNHVRWLLGGVCPKDHILQCQGGMFVTGYKEWLFASYCRGFPPFVVTVKSDPEAQVRIEEAVDAFHKRLDEGWDRMVEANGGPPKRYEPTPEDLAHQF